MQSLEIAVEIARILKQMMQGNGSRSIDVKDLNRQLNERLNEMSSRIDEKLNIAQDNSIASGEVKLSELKKSGEVSMQTNISALDMATINAKAKEYDIPVSFIGKGENADNVTMAFRSEDKAAVDQILQDVLAEKMAVKPNDYLTFEMDNIGEAQTMAEMLKENNIPADITMGSNGKYQCIYEAKNAEAVKIVKNDLRATHADIAQNFSITPKDDGFVLTDKQLGKSLTLTSMPTKEQLMKVLKSQKQFGYSDNKALAAANKLENTLSGDKLEFFRTDTRQAALLNNFERNIRLADDNILTKPYSFTRANFVSDNVNRYFVSNGDRAAALIPDQMTREEMADTVRYKLGVTDPETVKAIVDKTEKIEVANKVAEIKKEAEISRQNGDIGIERRAENFFEASQGAMRKGYYLGDKKQTIKELQKDFGISAQKAESIFQKAQKQSPLSFV